MGIAQAIEQFPLISLGAFWCSEVIVHHDGDGKVLKSHSEVKPVTKSTVYELAQSQSLDGRSEMTKDELLKALT